MFKKTECCGATSYLITSALLGILTVAWSISFVFLYPAAEWAVQVCSIAPEAKYLPSVLGLRAHLQSLLRTDLACHHLEIRLLTPADPQHRGDLDANIQLSLHH